MKEKIAIVMPYQGGFDFTERAIEGVLTNTRVPFTLFLVNDGKEKYEITNDNIVHLETGGNKGFCVATNTGLKQCVGNKEFTHIVLLNNDAIITNPAWVDILKAPLDEDEKVVGSGPTSNFVMGRQMNHYDDGRTEEGAKLLSFFCIMLTRKSIDKVGLLDEKFLNGSDDLDWCYRASKLGFSFKICRNLFVYHIGSATIRGDDAYWKKGNEQFADKWGREEMIAFCKPNPILVIGRPTWGMNDYRFTDCLSSLIKPEGTEPVTAPRQPVHRARNQIVKEALKSGAEHVFFVDDDMLFEKEWLIKLISYNKDIVGGFAWRREKPYDPCVFKYFPDATDGKNWGSLYPKQGLRRVDALGMSFTLVSRKVLLKIAEKYEQPFEWTKWGEDITFCKRATDLGFEVWCDTDMDVFHIGDNLIVGRQFAMQYQKLKQEHPELDDKKFNVLQI